MNKIIHIDNSEFFRKLMRTFLSGEGFEVESFDTAEDAGMAINGGTASMVITGLAIADMSGETFIQKVAESFAGPIVILSSSINDDQAAALKSLGVRAAINKSGKWKDELLPYLDPIR
jgi:two-component system cell cycle response regulator